MSESVQIRPYRPADEVAVSTICLKTAAAGADATGLYASDELMPDVFARPYLEFEPEWAWVVDSDAGVIGYILCAPDTAGFVERFREHWVPYLSERYTHVEPALTPDESIRHLGFWPERMLIPELDEYPAHMHIDLLPEAQGLGLGRQLIDTLVTALRAAGVPGLHLGMDPSNTGARAFYNRLGFHELPSSTADGPSLGLRLA